jgi:hypothetical protein
LGIGVLVLFFVSPTDGQPGPKPVGEQVDNQTKDESGGRPHEDGKSDLPPIRPMGFVESNAEHLEITDRIGVTLSKSVVSEERHRRGGGAQDNKFYDLKLFEGSKRSDGIVDLGQELRAVASTDDSSVEQVTFGWLDPTLNMAMSFPVPLNSSGLAEHTFEPDMPGEWKVQADFGNGNIVTDSFTVQFFVVPESPLGVFLLITSSVAAFVGYSYFRKLRAK